MPATRVGRLPNHSALTAAALSAAAGLLHVAVIRTHAAESAIDGVLMLAAAWLQLGFAVVLLVAPTRAVRLAGAVGLWAIAVGWGIARVTGLPFGHSHGAPEDVRLLGTVTTVLGVLAAFAALAGARPGADPTATTGPPSRAAPVAAAGLTLAALLSAVLLLSPTGHGGGGDQADHGHGGAMTGDHGTDSTGGGGHGGSGDGHHDQGATDGPAPGTAGVGEGPGTTPSPVPTAPPRHELADGDDGHAHAPDGGP